MSIFFKTITIKTKKEEPIIFLFQKIKTSKQILAVCGLSAGCGTTCISLSLANYLCNKRKRRTAYIELNPSGQIRGLYPKLKKESFYYMGITFFPKVTLSMLPDLLQREYDYFILDMGILNQHTAQEFARCHKKYIVADCSPWKVEQSIQNLEHLIKQKYINQEQVIILGNPMKKESIYSGILKNFSKFISVPHIKNPFQIASVDFVFYEQMLSEN